MINLSVAILQMSKPEEVDLQRSLLDRMARILVGRQKVTGYRHQKIKNEKSYTELRLWTNYICSISSIMVC